MKHKSLEPETLEAVADRFKVLAEPARLAILNALRRMPMTVSLKSAPVSWISASCFRRIRWCCAMSSVSINP